MHFQYNGYLLGILLASLCLLREGRDWLGGVVFAVLVCSKHLFLVAGPVYFVYLLRHFCRGGFWKGFCRFLWMGVGVGVVFAAAFAPWVHYGQIPQLLGRLFPFGRGLCHAYWAPNFWVFYIIMDKALAFMMIKLGFNIQMPKASFTGGLVGDSSPFAVLPQVTPPVTFLLVLLAMSPCIVKAFLKPKPKSIIRWVSYAYTCGYMFGWHVHEKASLHFTIPLGIIALDSLEDARHYFLLSIVSCYSLFPLLFEPQEYPIKVLLLLLHSTLLWIGFTHHFNRRERSSTTTTTTKTTTKNKVKSKRPEATFEKKRLIGWIGICYLLGLVFIEIWGQILHPYIFGARFPFLPLMLVSVYSAFGMMYSWLWQLKHVMLHT